MSDSVIKSKAVINEEEGNNIAIDHLFIHFKIFFEDDEENPISNISRETKFGDIIDEVFCIGRLTTFREFIEDIVKTSSITYRFSNVKQLDNLENIVESIEHIKANIDEEIDATQTIEFFSALTIKDICSYKNEKIGLI